MLTLKSVRMSELMVDTSFATLSLSSSAEKKKRKSPTASGRGGGRGDGRGDKGKEVEGWAQNPAKPLKE